MVSGTAIIIKQRCAIDFNGPDAVIGSGAVGDFKFLAVEGKLKIGPWTSGKIIDNIRFRAKFSRGNRFGAPLRYK